MSRRRDHVRAKARTRDTETRRQRRRDRKEAERLLRLATARRLKRANR